VTIDPRFLVLGNPWLTVYEETKYGLYGSSPMDDEAVDAVVVSPQEATRSYAGFLDLMVGVFVDFSAAATTFALEVCAVFFRVMAHGCNYLVGVSSHNAWSKYTIGALCWILWANFWFVENTLLYTSIFVTELLAGVSWLLCGWFALDCEIARAAHQRTRRLSHLTRWACRRPFASTSAITQETSHSLTATAISEGNSNHHDIQTATVVAIHDDIEYSK